MACILLVMLLLTRCDRIAFISLMKPLAISVPDCLRPSRSNHDGVDLWSAYTGQSDLVESHSDCVFNAFCDLSQINIEANSSVFDDTFETLSLPNALKRTLDNLQDKLEKRESSLPDCTSLRQAAVPQALCLR